MPSTSTPSTSGKSRYKGFGQSTLVEPIDGGHTSRTEIAPSNNDESTNHIDSLTPDIDPPEGFQPRPETPSSEDVGNTNGNTICSSRNSNSSSGSRPDKIPLNSTHKKSNRTRESTNESTTTANGQPRPPQSDIVPDSIENAQENIPVPSQLVSASTNGVSHHRQNDYVPSTSSSYKPHRLISGLNCFMTKITKAFANTSLSMINTDRCNQDEVPRFAFGHKRSLEKTWKLMDKVVNCCQRPEMNLNNSPPFILDILPETYQQLNLIHTKHNASHKQPINDNDYSRIFLSNLQNRCKQTLKLFKDAKEEMFNVESDYRHKLTRNTLVFNHILSELRAIFPNGEFIGEKYLITKKESAGEFWRNSFGTSVLIDWDTFYHALQQVHSIDSSFFSSHALKQTMDLTCDGYISIFEFDVFTRLFQPWSTLLRNWQILAVTHPGYKAFLTYDELKARLQKHIDKPGSYVFRLSCTRLGQWAIGYVTPDRQILQTIVQNISLSQALTETKVYLYPDGKDEDPNLNVLCSGLAGDERNVTVTEEQYEIYCGVGNSFQTCKICFENDKDIRVEPCNHLLCTSCLIAWQESEGQGCPYCRTEIKETVQIFMDLPKSKS